MSTEPADNEGYFVLSDLTLTWHTQRQVSDYPANPISFLRLVDVDTATTHITATVTVVDQISDQIMSIAEPTVSAETLPGLLLPTSADDEATPGSAPRRPRFCPTPSRLLAVSPSGSMFCRRVTLPKKSAPA